MRNVTRELTTLARKLGYTGKAPNTVAKAINAIAASIDNGGGGGCGNPYEYLGIEFITINIASHTLPPYSGGDTIEIERISAQSTVGEYPRPLLQVNTFAEPGVNQLIVPIASEKTTEIYLQATTNVGDLIPRAATVTGDISYDTNTLYVTGHGSIANITWKYSD